MDFSTLEVVTAAARPDLADPMQAIVEESWPAFMFNDKICEAKWEALYRLFPEFQLAVIDRESDHVVAMANSIPLAWSGHLSQLSDDGVRWALVTGIEDALSGANSTVVCALQIVIPKDLRGQQLSRRAVEAMRNNVCAQGLETLIAPVRPNAKARFPHTPMAEYMLWQTDEGLPFDPWMRVHARLGAQIIKVCQAGLEINGSAKEWESWTGMKFPESGSYVVPEALVPVEYDKLADVGTYIEPNVWMVHSCNETGQPDKETEQAPPET